MSGGPTLPGRNLFDTTTIDGPIFMERDRPPPWRQRGIRVGSKSLWVIEELDPEHENASVHPGTARRVENVKPGIYLFDDSVQPGERLNLYFEGDPTGKDLLSLLNEHFEAARPAPPARVDLDKDLSEKLRSLGYVE